MKRTAALIFFLLIISSASIAQKVKKWKVDNYPVPDVLLEAAPSDKASTYEKISGKIHSLDKVWLTNDTLKQTLVIEMYTDLFRTIIFHFMNNDIPDGLLEAMELTNDDDTGEKPPTISQKAQAIKDFIRTSKKTSQRYFKSDKGFRLGDSKSTALKLYGTPDKTSVNNNVEMLQWDFTGDEIMGSKYQPTIVKRIAKDSYGHQVTLFFKADKLIAIILHNDIP